MTSGASVRGAGGSCRPRATRWMWPRTAKEGLEKVRSKPFDLLLVDLMMPLMGGLEMMEQVKAYDPEIIMIVITGFATVETAVDAMKHGAYDYVPKPFTPDQLLAVVNRGLETRRLRFQAGRSWRSGTRSSWKWPTRRRSSTPSSTPSADGILVFNREKQLVLWNPAVVKMLNLEGRPGGGQGNGGDHPPERAGERSSARPMPPTPPGIPCSRRRSSCARLRRGRSW